MKLNDKQKQFLFDKGYITAVVLDAAVEDGWMEHYITRYEWDLGHTPNQYGGYELNFYEVDLADKGIFQSIEEFEIFLTDEDIDQLIMLG